VAEETATVPEAAPAPIEGAATAQTEPKPEQKPDWEAAYKGIQRTIAKRDQRIEQLVGELQSRTAPLESGMDVLLKAQLGEEGYKAHVQEQQAQSERTQALAAAQTAQQYIPQSINVIAETMRLAGVADADIQQVFAVAADAANVQDWASAVKAGTQIAIAKAKASETAKAETAVKANSQKEIAAEANALAERTLRAKGIDKVDLGKGQTVADRGFVSKVKSIDRNTTEGEAEYQKMLKEAKRGTLQVR